MKNTSGNVWQWLHISVLTMSGLLIHYIAVWLVIKQSLAFCFMSCIMVLLVELFDPASQPFGCSLEKGSRKTKMCLNSKMKSECLTLCPSLVWPFFPPGSCKVGKAKETSPFTPWFICLKMLKTGFNNNMCKVTFPLYSCEKNSSHAYEELWSCGFHRSSTRISFYRKK